MQIEPTFFPTLNAFLNGTSGVLIGSGLYFIRKRRIEAHKRLMIAAFITSTLFLISYLYYHLVLRAGVTHFKGKACRGRSTSPFSSRTPFWPSLSCLSFWLRSIAR